MGKVQGTQWQRGQGAESRATDWERAQGRVQEAEEWMGQGKGIRVSHRRCRAYLVAQLSRKLVPIVCEPKCGLYLQGSPALGSHSTSAAEWGLEHITSDCQSSVLSNWLEMSVFYCTIKTFRVQAPSLKTSINQG